MLLAQEVKKAVGYCGEYMEEASASAALIARMRFDTCSARRAACPPPDTPWLPGPPGSGGEAARRGLRPAAR